MAATVEPKVLLGEGALRLVALPPFTIAWYGERMERADVHRLWESYRNDALPILGGPMYAASVITPEATKFGDGARQMALKMAKDLAPKTAASATVLTAGGLIGSIQRSIATSFNLVNRPPHPTKVFSTFSDAAVWLVDHSDGAVSTEALEAALATIRP